MWPLMVDLLHPSISRYLGSQVTMKLRTAYIAGQAALWQNVATAVPSCSIASFQNVLPGNATILSAAAVANGSTYGEGASDIAYPSSFTHGIP